ncbi:MAG: ABC transporter permease [Thaumarchaeota archaeon]|nr:ABC transporter permease [Candidatus Terraquivivens yellowstonensis]MCL7393037.1 ABC transporter permease [Candidatus Terraquivivens yellowstonensis]MCL7395598.1 ABC transporter permease [Candidatus Terraquivivens yellowstonensis]MCL7398353.1 ABC transporter permease [Candidatus Terraquivivens yellowstonensis]MCL7401047.1 ABC transporter permease [Candidatus Terraquivivens yellowstonensis]
MSTPQLKLGLIDKVAKYSRYLLLLPGFVLILLFLLIPLSMIIGISFFERFTVAGPENFTLKNYITFFTSPQTPVILWNTFGMSLLACLITFLLGYPMAYFLVFRVKSARTRFFVVSLLLVPFLIDWSVRVVAWLPILGESGIVNYTLMYLGVIKEPLELLFGRSALLIIWPQTYLLWMIFPSYLALTRIDPDIINAAKVLKAPPHRVFFDITFRLSLPGVVMGFIFVFVSALGDYITPALWAGGIQTLGLSVANYAANFVWPYAAALSTILVAIALLILYLLLKVVDIKKLVY